MLAGYARFVAVIALIVIVLGAYTRLSDAGLGCPDWPGCYGHLDVPKTSDEVARANQLYPDRPVEAHKAWKEMIHRYFAGSLGVLIAILAVWAWRRRAELNTGVALPVFLVALVVFQALLGMWTVTLKVKPVIVMSHLLGGFATLSLLWLFAIREGRRFVREAAAAPTLLRLWVGVALLVLIAQIALGGWTSTNYAALACTAFPQCHTGVWWPAMDFKEGFVLWRGLGIDYEFGVLENPARVAIHMTHRIGAIVTLLVVGLLGVLALRSGIATLRRIGAAILVLLAMQVGLGITNIVAALPLYVAVAHNAVGALLLLGVITLAKAAWERRDGYAGG